MYVLQHLVDRRAMLGALGERGFRHKTGVFLVHRIYACAEASECGKIVVKELLGGVNEATDEKFTNKLARSVYGSLAYIICRSISLHRRRR